MTSMFATEMIIPVHIASTSTSPVEALKGTGIDSEVECTESDAISKLRNANNRNVMPIATVQKNEPKVSTVLDNYEAVNASVNISNHH